MPELNGRQRLELALLCEDYEGAPDQGLAGMCRLVDFVVAESINPDQFGRRDKTALNPGYTASLMVTYRHDFEPGSFGNTVLIASGLLPVPGSDEGIPF